MERLRNWLGKPVDGGSLAVFRILLGLAIAWIVVTAIRTGEFGTYTQPGGGVRWSFAYPGLEFIRPLPTPGLDILLLVCLASSILVALGFLYRPAAWLLFLSFFYLANLDRTMTGNHLVLGIVFTFLLAWTPAHRRYSLDRLAWPKRPGVVGDPPGTIPFWPIALLRAQVFLVYLYGGISKLHPDWLGGQPLRLWLNGQAAPLASIPKAELTFGQALQKLLATEGAVYLISYGGLIFDLGIGFLLLWRRTRILAMVLAAGFHLFNFFRVDLVGVVAPMAMAGTLLFLDPDWPDRLGRWLKKPTFRRPDLGWLVAGAILVPGIGALLGWEFAPTASSPGDGPDGSARGAPPGRARPVSGLVMAAGGAWLLFAVLVPLRHFAIPGDAYWTDEGVHFSWFLMTRNKIGGYVQFRVDDPELFPPPTEGIDRAASGAKQERPIDWSKWKGDRPEVVFQEVDVRKIPWYTMPEFFVTYEPILGERIFFNTGVSNLVSLDQAKARAEARWKEMYGRVPAVLPTFPLQKIIDAELRELKAKERPGNADSAPLIRALTELGAWSERMRERNLDEDKFRGRHLADPVALLSLASLAQKRKEFLTKLVTVSPFDLEGNPVPPIAPLLVVDKQLLNSGKGVFWKIDRSLWRGDNVDYLALDMLMPTYLRTLPPVYFLRDPTGRPWCVWNHSLELNESQIRHVSIIPELARQYASHVADEWEKQQGRRPRVHGQAYAKLNDHPFQEIIDSSVDLAAQPQGILHHATWIPEMKKAEAPAPHSAPASAPAPAPAPSAPAATTGGLDSILNTQPTPDSLKADLAAPVPGLPGPAPAAPDAPLPALPGPDGR